MRTTSISLLACRMIIIIACTLTLTLIITTTASVHATPHAQMSEQDEALAMLRKLKAEEFARRSECHSPFGSLNGVGNGVAFFSNCNDHYISEAPHLVLWDRIKKKVLEDGFDPENFDLHEKFKDGLASGAIFQYTAGMKHQCVAGARRYLLNKFGLVFQDVGGAFDIWRLTFLVAPDDANFENRRLFERFPGFTTAELPREGDVVVYPSQKDMPFGHVAVIVDVKIEPEEKVADENKDDVDVLVARAFIAEQNFHNKVWPGSKTHARELHVYRRAGSGGMLGLKDPDGHRVLGFQRPRPDVQFTGAYSHADDGVDALEAQGLPQRVAPVDAVMDAPPETRETAAEAGTVEADGEF